jgi:hypothetical protein
MSFDQIRIKTGLRAGLPGHHECDLKHVFAATGMAPLNRLLATTRLKSDSEGGEISWEAWDQ